MLRVKTPVRRLLGGLDWLVPSPDRLVTPPRTLTGQTGTESMHRRGCPQMVDVVFVLVTVVVFALLALTVWAVAKL